MSVRLYGYWRSSAAYRVRIALNLKGVAYEHVGVHLVRNEHAAPDYAAINESQLVPTLDYQGETLTQSPAIITFLDETHPEPPFLPADPVARARVRAMASIIACDIHPIANLRVLRHVKNALGGTQEQVDAWRRHWPEKGLTALETLAARHSRGGRYCFGDELTAADIYLAPQMYNARRAGCEVSRWPTLTAIDTHLLSLPAFAAAAPESQPDAE
ncbi:MAG: maleylacetoacetate isomerase [Caulobacterales bacterium]|nr:maleylacetoacetate isomerase [Caulobacterales bacterium]